MQEELQAALFPDDGDNTYAVIDGASCPELLGRLREFQLEHACLYAGELAPDVAACAPYLVLLDPDSEFTSWLIDEGWGKHWGIFARSAVNLRALRKHFRTFLMVRNPVGKSIYFRYYDPRVLRLYLPTCNAVEARTVFGPVISYFCEGTDRKSLLVFSTGEGIVIERRSAVA